jgi:tellurite resistance protein TerC
MVMRGTMIGLGAALIQRLHWVLYLFGGFLLVTGLKMLVGKPQEVDVEHNLVLRWLRRRFPITRCYRDGAFFIRGEPPAGWMLTPLAVALVLVEVADLVFAVDSIPAIFAITADPFLVFTSNVFAILGLRSLFFALAGMIRRFVYLRPALALVLMLVGAKMLAARWLKPLLGEAFNPLVLGTVLAILAIGIVASLRAGSKADDDR